MHMFVFAWRTYPELQWETTDLVSLLCPLCLLLILQPYNMASASTSPDVSAALRETIAWEVALTVMFTA